MQEVERYNRLLKASEDATIALIKYTLNKSFNRLVRRVRQHLKNPERTGVVNRNLLLLQDLNTLIPAVNPNSADEYDRLFTSLLQQSSNYGIDVAKLTTPEFRDRQINVSIPLDAVVAQAKQAHGYLRKHGEVFAQTSTEIVMKGLIEGRPTDLVIKEMRDRLGVTKSRAAVIVRTESLRSYAAATDTYYAQMGIDYVSWYVGADERACPACTPRAGLIYKRSEVKIPLHPQCRCYLAPYDPTLAVVDQQHREAPMKHRQAVAKEKGLRKLPDPSILNQAPPGLFEERTPAAVSQSTLT